MNIFNCQHDYWPICLYNFTYKNRIPEQLVFRSTKSKPNVIFNYFYGGSSVAIKHDPKKTPTSNKDSDGLLMERTDHYCF